MPTPIKEKKQKQRPTGVGKLSTHYSIEKKNQMKKSSIAYNLRLGVLLKNRFENKKQLFYCKNIWPGRRL